MDMNDVWAILVGFVGVWFLVFLYFEMYALFTHRVTLSGWIRIQLGIEPVEPKHVWLSPLFAFIIFGFAAWFVPHIEKWLPW